MTDEQVWRQIAGSPISDLVHPAYHLGMPRLSCRLCILASRGALIRSAQLNPELAAEYLQVERETGHSFRQDCSMEEVVHTARAGEAPAVDRWIG